MQENTNELISENDWIPASGQGKKNHNKKKLYKPSKFYIKLHDKNVRDIPEEIIPLYIGEILTMETDVQGICNDLLSDFSVEFYHSYRPQKLEDYDSPHNGHYEDVCACHECFIWLEKNREYLKKNPFIRYMHEFARENIHVWTGDNPFIIYYNTLFEDPQNNGGTLSGGKIIIDLNGIPREKWIFQGKNDTEKHLITLLLREYDPYYIRKYYTNWFKLLIRDRLPFRHSTIILYNVKDIKVEGRSYVAIKLGVDKPLEYNFDLKPYRGNFTFLHIRFIRQRLLSLGFPGKKSKIHDNRNRPFYLSKSSDSGDTHINTEFINGILTIKISQE